LAAIDEVVGGASVVVALRVGGEAEAAAPAGSAGQIGARLQDLVEQLAVVGGDVLHVAHILVAPLDLEASHAGVDQHGEVGRLVVVLHRRHVLRVGADAPGLVGDVVGQPAGLRTVAAVGAASGVGVADVALAAVGHAQRAVDEDLDDAARRVGGRADGADL